MLYTRKFNLKPYWDKFIQGVKEYRDFQFKERGYRDRPTQNYIVDGQEWMFGASTCIIPPDKVGMFIDEDLEKIYHRKNLALKIFYFCPQPLSINPHSYRWGRNNNLIDATKMQNIFAQGRLAPYVYDVVSLINNGCKYPAQITDYIDHDTAYDVLAEDSEAYKGLVEYAYNNRITMFDVLEGKNWMAGKLVDFEFFSFDNNKSEYIDFIGDTIRGLSFGGDNFIPYQSIEELNVIGRRNNIERGKLFNFEEMKNASVLDVACNGAYFLRRCMDLGASYGVGMDIPAVVHSASIINNYLGYFNVDFVKKLPEGKFDIVFYLSGTGYGIDDKEVFDRVGKTLYFEGHGGQTEEMCRKLLEPYFKVELLGKVNDYPESGERLMFKCQK